jgi:hypothetical protein
MKLSAMDLCLRDGKETAKVSFADERENSA